MTMRRAPPAVIEEGEERIEEGHAAMSNPELHPKLVFPFIITSRQISGKMLKSIAFLTLFKVVSARLAPRVDTPDWLPKDFPLKDIQHSVPLGTDAVMLYGFDDPAAQDAKLLTMGVVSKSGNVWSAIGISDNGAMTGADIFVCRKNEAGQVVVEDRHASGYVTCSLFSHSSALISVFSFNIWPNACTRFAFPAMANPQICSAKDGRRTRSHNFIRITRKQCHCMPMESTHSSSLFNGRPGRSNGQECMDYLRTWRKQHF